MSRLTLLIIADAGLLVTPDNLWQAWNVDALVLLNLMTLGLFYTRGFQRLRQRTQTARILNMSHAVAFSATLLVVALALLSPLDALSEQLGSAHMVQHMLLMLVAAPLVIYARPQAALTWGLPPRWRKTAGSVARYLAADFLSWPWVVGILYAIILWAWHLPVAYQAALFDPLLHDAQHLSFFGGACLFWRTLFVPFRRGRSQPFVVIGLLFFTAIHSMVLGVFMALSPQVWYEVYSPSTAAWGLSASEDQQLAGLLMWLPGCLIYPAAAAIHFGSWLARLRTAPALPVACASQKGA